MRTVEEIGHDLDLEDSFEGIQKYVSELFRVALSYEKELRDLKAKQCPPDERVVEIYNLYPRKAARPAAIKAIKAAIKKIGHEALLAHVRAYAEHHNAAGIELQYTPMPSTWFNQERWNDTPVEQVKPKSIDWTRINALRNAIRTSPAFPGGIYFVDHTKPETKELLKQNIAELLQLNPNERLSDLRA